MSEHPVLIAGAGIGGLSLANGLQRAGVPVRVFERAPKLEAVGAGLTLHANARSALRALGVEDRVAARSALARRMVLRSAAGKVLVDSAATELAPEAPLAVHRAALQRVLLEQVEDSVQLGAEVVSFEESADGVRAKLADGAAVLGRALVGADGIHSQVCAQLHGKRVPRYSGYTCWRGVAPGDAGDTLGGESWGDEVRFGIVPLREGTYWFATENTEPGQKDGSDVTRELLARFGRFHAPIPQLIEATPAEAVFRADIFDHPPLECWGAGAVTLLGDAAHAMTPNLGQGACQAIEDAAVLARQLARQSSVVSAFQEYERARRGRANRFVRESWRMGKMGQISSPGLRKLRNWAVGVTPRGIRNRSMRWMFDQSFESVTG